MNQLNQYELHKKFFYEKILWYSVFTNTTHLGMIASYK